MQILKWAERYSTDCKLKYGSEATQNTYLSCVKIFLEYFKHHKEPKEIPTQEVNYAYPKG